MARSPHLVVHATSVQSGGMGADIASAGIVLALGLLVFSIARIRHGRRDN